MAKGSRGKPGLVELVVAGGLIAVGLYSWHLAPLVVLAPHIADVGKDWLAGILQRGFGRFARNWFGDRGILNEDILWSLDRAFAKAFDHIERDWQHHPRFTHLQRTAPEAAGLTLSGLNLLAEDVGTISRSPARMRAIVERGEFTRLFRKDEAGIREFLSGILKDYLYGHDAAFVDFVYQSLPEALVTSFEEVLISAGERETRVRNAVERIWLLSLLDTQALMSEQLTQILQGQASLKDQLDHARVASVFEHETIVRGALIDVEASLLSRFAEILLDHTQSDRRAYLSAVLSASDEKEALAYIHLSGSSLKPLPPTISSQIAIPPSFKRVVYRRASSVIDRPTHFGTLETALEASKQVVILGPPGSGKSTLLENQLLRLGEDALIDTSAPIPVLIDLGDEWRDAKTGVQELIDSALRARGLGMRHPRGVVLLFDGIDRIQRANILDKSKAMAKWMSDNPGTRVVATCRTDYEIAEFPPDIPTIIIEPLDDQKIEFFLVETLGEVNAHVVLQQLVTDPVSGSPRDIIHLARTPFFLAIIAYTFDPGNPRDWIPTTRGGLFRLLVEALFERETTDREPPYDASLRPLLAALGAVSYSTHVLGAASKRMEVKWAAKQLPRDQVALDKQIWRLGREMSVLDLSKGESLIKFRHDLLSEYFAAEYIAASPQTLGTLLSEPSLRGGKRLPGDWDQVMFMLAGLIPPEALLELVASKDPFLAVACLDHVPVSSTLHKEVDAIIIALRERLLFTDRESRATSVTTLTRMKHQDRVVACMGILTMTVDPFAKRRAIEVLRVSSEQESAARAIAAMVFDEDKWVRREAEDALIDIGDPAVAILEDLFAASKTGPQRQQVVKILTSIPSVRSVQLLLTALGDQDQEVWREAKRALDLSDMDLSSATASEVNATRDTARSMLASSDRALQRMGLQVLSVIGERQDVPFIVQILHQGEPALAILATEALGTLGGTDVGDELIGLIASAGSARGRVSDFQLAAAASSLGLIRDGSAIPILEWLLSSSSSSFARSSAARALGRLRACSSVGKLVRALRRDENSFVRANCALTLGLIADKRAIGPLVASLDPETEAYERVRGYAAYGLGLLGGTGLTRWLAAALTDEDDKVRQSAAVALALTREEDACDCLAEAIETDPVHYVRQWAALAMGAIGSDRGLAGLERALTDSESYVRQKAAGALKGIDSSRSRELLASLMNDSDRYVRQQAVIGLGVLNAADCVRDVWRLKKDPSDYVRAAVAWTVGQLGDIRAIQHLIELSRDPKSHLVRENAVEALGRLGRCESVVVEALLVSARDPSDFVRRHAVAALGKQDAVDAIDVLKELHRTDHSSYVRREAYNILRTERFRAWDRATAGPVGGRGKDDSPHGSTYPAPEQDIRDFSHLRSQETTVRHVRHLVEEGRLNEILGQALLDPRQYKREVAQAVLWTRSEEPCKETNSEDTARAIAERMGEGGRLGIERIAKIVEVCGAEFSLRVLARILQEEPAATGERHRSLAHAFFDLTQRLLDDDTRGWVFNGPSDMG